MNAEIKRKTLGRGLDALFGDSDSAPVTVADALAANAAQLMAESNSNTKPRTLPTAVLVPSSVQPRRRFDDSELASLAASIAVHGVLQPLLVRPDPAQAGRYEIIAGERRWRASQIAQLHELPVVIQELTDSAALEIALIENIQRQDLTAIEEAEAYRRLMDEYGHTQEKLASAVGKSRSHIANMLRLLTLPAPVVAMVHDGRLTAGHARALIGTVNALEWAERIIADKLSVRDIEERIAAGSNTSRRKPTGGTPAAPNILARIAKKDPDTMALEQEMTDLLGMKVAIDADGMAGTFTIHYQSLDQLDYLLQRLTESARRG